MGKCNSLHLKYRKTYNNNIRMYSSNSEGQENFAIQNENKNSMSKEELNDEKVRKLKSEPILTKNKDCDLKLSKEAVELIQPTVKPPINPNAPIEISVNAILGPVDYPIYVKENTKITIKIKNQKDKWSFLGEKGPVTFKGYESEKYNHKNLGALLFKVSTEEESQLIDKEEMEYSVSSNGSLIFFANLDYDSNNHYEFSGAITVEIYGGYLIGFSELDKLIGYNNLEEEDRVNSPFTKKIIRLINKARVNPKAFFREYMVGTNVKKDEEIENLMSSLTSSPGLQYNMPLQKAAISHCKDIGTNGTTGHLGSDGSTVKDRINKYDKNIKYFGENCSFGLNNPLLIIIEMVIDKNGRDKNNRNNLFNPEFKFVGVAFGDHFSFDYGCVITFGNTTK